MKMNIGLGQKLTVTQKLAPQLIQSLKMLHMPALKLEQTIRQELAANPMLEEVEALEEETESTTEEESEFDLTKDEEKSGDDEFDWDEYLYDDDEGYKVRESREVPEDRFHGGTAATSNLYDHLTEQLHMLKLSEDETLIGEYIIGNISPDGYLSISVAEMAAELDREPSAIEEVLSMIHRFDPTGVGARDLRESLLIQLREKGMEGSLPWRIVDEHIKELDRKSILQISKMMNVPEDKAQAALKTIRSLSPKPAQGRFDPAAMPVVPDLVVERVGEEFVVMHNDDHIPRLRINQGYRSLMKRGKGASQETKSYIREKLEQARWLLNAINQRRSTMIRVMEAIVKRQHDFFERGPAFLKPLIMEDIAQMVEMNVATISRVSNGKYVQTPLGVYEIRHFFNTGISRENGEDMSKRSVKMRIQEIIDKEPPGKPYSDQQIYKLLNEEGIKLARRTVTKYREELKIPAARLRKRVS